MFVIVIIVLIQFFYKVTFSVNYDAFCTHKAQNVS